MKDHSCKKNMRIHLLEKGKDGSHSENGMPEDGVRSKSKDKSQLYLRTIRKVQYMKIELGMNYVGIMDTIPENGETDPIPENVVTDPT